MTDHDELLARADVYWANAGPLWGGRELIAELAAALRAALAAQPELVQVGWFEDAKQAGISLRYHQSFANIGPPFPNAVPIFVRSADMAAARSATAEEDR